MANNKLLLTFILYKHRINKNGQCPISLRITINGHRDSISTGINVEAKYWDSAKGKIKGNSEVVSSKNNLLQSLKSKAISIYTEITNSGDPLSSSIIKSKLKGVDKKTTTLLEAILSHNKYVYKKIDTDITKATYTKYETLRKKVEIFLAKEYCRRDILLSELNQKFIIRFELFLKSEERIAHNTTIKYIQFLKRVICYSIANEWIEYDPFKAFKCTLKPVIRECLSLAELEVLNAKQLHTKRLEIVRDLFVFSCYTGLAYSDLKKLKTNEITTGVDGSLWIQTFRAKTKTRVPVPLLETPLKILQKYTETNQTSGLVFNVLSNQKMNAYLKEIADICGIEKKLTFHIGRHTFATTITLSNGVPIETVSKMLGHTNIKTTQIYSKVVDSKLSIDMAKLSNQLKDKKQGC